MRTDNGEPDWLLSDHLGSTSVVANYDGTQQAIQLYKAWGEKRFPTGPSTLPTTFRYTGQRQEVSLGGSDGLYFYGARWYDAYLSRFIQADTIVPGAGNPLSWDRYAGMNNNPVRYSDPTGHVARENKEEYRWSFSWWTLERRLKREYGDFRVSFSSGWSPENILIVYAALQEVGNALASAAARNLIGMTASEAFNAVYDHVEFVWSGNGNVGGYTHGANNIEFYGLYSSVEQSVRLVVHELGHAFDQVIGNARGGDAWSKGIRTDLTGKMGLCDNGLRCLGRDGHTGDPELGNPFGGLLAVGKNGNSELPTLLGKYLQICSSDGHIASGGVIIEEKSDRHSWTHICHLMFGLLWAIERRFGDETRIEQKYSNNRYGIDHNLLLASMCQIRASSRRSDYYSQPT